MSIEKRCRIEAIYTRSGKEAHASAFRRKTGFKLALGG